MTGYKNLLSLKADLETGPDRFADIEYGNFKQSEFSLRI